MTSRNVVIVDPYSSGTLLAPEFIKRGFQCIAVHSKPLLGDTLSSSYRSVDFIHEFFFNSDLEQLCEKISSFYPICVVPGTESGVLLADELAYNLDLPHNSILLSSARRDKFLMQNCIKAAGLRSIEHYVTENLQDALLWQAGQANGIVVVKPLNSAGSDNVRLCETVEEMEKVFLKILSSPNLYGEKNERVLLQEYIQGEEYVVDAVSKNGKHVVTNICKYTKDIVNGSFIYRETRYLPATGKIASILTDYNDAVLDALDILFGASHSEIILTDKGPVLVEVGARLHGGITSPQVIESCSVKGPVTLLVDCYTNENEFHKCTGLPNLFNSHAVAFTFANKKAGILTEIPAIKILSNLSSFFSLKLNVKNGDYLKFTTDLYSSPGWVVLKNKDENQLEIDLDFVKTLERDDKLFTVR
ncbi:ATP-grasp domain-containing protein [Sodalis sp. RH14]|uniref:ATP-grasp domain-containing protein n=1 Tax=Sodalis sp. RH14 TaxID=3394329 RepID=UPI0039B4D735